MEEVFFLMWKKGKDFEVADVVCIGKHDGDLYFV